METMRYRPLKDIDKKASVLVYGTGNSKIMGNDTGLACECLDMAWEMGFTVFDTAHSYGNAEKNVGIWMERRGLRDKIILLDKGCNPGQYGSTDVMTPELIRSQLEESLDRMKTDCTDMYLLHRDDESRPVGPVVEVLNELKEEGKIKYFGGSNWNYERIAEANEYARNHGLTGFTVASPCFNMVEMKGDPWGGSVHISGPDRKEARKWYRENDIPVFSYSSLARGFLSGKYHTKTDKKIEECLSWAPIAEYCDPGNIEKLEKAEELAEKKGCTVSQIALAWLLAQEMTVYPIVSPSTEEHLLDNIGAFKIQLSTEDFLHLLTGQKSVLTKD